MFNKYQDQACGTFKVHKALTPHQSELLDWNSGLGGEVGEVQEIIKHHVYSDEPLDKMHLAKELGDVLWYISAMAKSNDIALEDIASLNLAKLSHRYDGGGYDNAKSLSRHEKEELFKNSPIYRVLEARINKHGVDAPVNIIFLGPDGSGKTTISKEVAKRLGFTYQKCDYRQPRKPELALSLLKSQTNMVYDRFYYPDDMLYCKVKGIEQEASYWAQYDAVDDMLLQLNTIIVYIDASDEVLKQRSKVWADDYVATTDLPHIKELYDNFLTFAQEEEKLAVLQYDTSNIEAESMDYQILIDMIIEDIDIERARFGGVKNADN
jgi:NTP pyrophosphatase (non-canonical NTP hydrolase)/deoxyadenosine/deoxycytidine kinase